MTASERTSLERELSDMRDDLTYLRVKSRRGERITDRETKELTERVDRFLARANNGRSLTTSTSGRRAPQNWSPPRHPPGPRLARETHIRRAAEPDRKNPGDPGIS